MTGMEVDEITRNESIPSVVEKRQLGDRRS